jgi:hypothetical protein
MCQRRLGKEPVLGYLAPLDESVRAMASGWGVNAVFLLILALVW